MVEGLFGGVLFHLCCRSLKHCVCIGLDHPKLLAVAVLDEYVKAWASGKCERARTVCCDRIESHGSTGVDNRAIYADGSEWTDQRTISVEIDAFNDGFRLRNAPDDVPAVGVE